MGNFKSIQHINADPQGLMELQAQILRYQQDISDTADNLLLEIKARNNTWNDSEFEMMLDELKKYRNRLRKTEEEMADMAKRVEQYARDLEQSRRKFTR